MTSINAHDYTVGEILRAATLDGVTQDLNTLLAQGIGEESVYIPVSGMVAETDSEPGAIEILDNDRIVNYGVPFGSDAYEIMNFNLVVPKRYDKGSLFIAFAWTTKVGASGNVTWYAEANILDDGDTIGADPTGGDGSATDAWQAAYDYQLTDFFEITPSGSVTGDNVLLEMRVARAGSEGGDTFASDAYLLGVLIRWTSDQETDD